MTEQEIDLCPLKTIAYNLAVPFHKSSVSETCHQFHDFEERFQKTSDKCRYIQEHIRS